MITRSAAPGDSSKETPEAADRTEHGHIIARGRHTSTRSAALPSAVIRDARLCVCVGCRNVGEVCECIRRAAAVAATSPLATERREGRQAFEALRLRASAVERQAHRVLREVQP